MEKGRQLQEEPINHCIRYHKPPSYLLYLPPASQTTRWILIVKPFPSDSSVIFWENELGWNYTAERHSILSREQIRNNFLHGRQLFNSVYSPRVIPSDPAPLWPQQTYLAAQYIWRTNDIVLCPILSFDASSILYPWEVLPSGLTRNTPISHLFFFVLSYFNLLGSQSKRYI